MEQKQPWESVWSYIGIFNSQKQIILYAGLTGFGEFVPQIISNDEFYSHFISKMLTYPSNLQSFPTKCLQLLY